MQTFPVMLNLTDRLAVVIGAGPVALRKVRALCNAGARVRLVSPSPPEKKNANGVELLQESYRPEHLNGAAIVFACTNDRQCNTRIARDAREMNVLVCAVDQPEDCDFFSPAVVHDGEVIVAVGTGGAAPGLAKYLANTLGEALPDRIGEFAACLASLREEMRNICFDARQRHTCFRMLVSEDTYCKFLAHGPAAVRKRFENIMKQGDTSCDSCV